MSKLTTEERDKLEKLTFQIYSCLDKLLFNFLRKRGERKKKIIENLELKVQEIRKLMLRSSDKGELKK